MTQPQAPKRWKKSTLFAVIASIVLIVSAGTGLIIMQSTHNSSNQVQVSGTIEGVSSGKLYFTTLDGKIQATCTVTNGQYSILLVGGQSYAVSAYGFGQTIDGTFYPQNTKNNFYVPTGVTTLTKDFP
jgi:hypothetical protein